MAKLKKPAAQHGWADDVHRIFAAMAVKQVAYVPDAGHTRLINLCHGDRGMRTIPLTTEEEGVALLAGAWLGGERGALLMQSSGVGNCINMVAMTVECRLPLLMLVTMRGDWGEFNPWQVPMGHSTPAVLEGSGVIVKDAPTASEVADTVAAATRLAFNTFRPVAVLLGQRASGAKIWNR
jgi:sulfopyruvate decarboxylase alpha subunit